MPRAMGITTTAGPGNTIIAIPMASNVKPMSAMMNRFTAFNDQFGMDISLKTRNGRVNYTAEWFCGGTNILERIPGSAGLTYDRAKHTIGMQRVINMRSMAIKFCMLFSGKLS